MRIKNNPMEEDGKNKKTVNRGDFFKKLLSIGAGSLAAAVAGESVALASGSSKGLKRKFNYGMVIDTRRCVGCRACVLACKSENKTPPSISYTIVFENILENRPNDKPVFMTKPCFHCENPSCTNVCPVSATYKRKDDGIVVIDYDRCIGCRYCMTACPYSARWFDFGENYPALEQKTAYAEIPSPEYKQFRKREHEKPPVGNVRKCTFCMHLQDENGAYNWHEGRWPACAKTCTGHAIHFGDFNDPESGVSELIRERQYLQLKEELGTKPNVYYLI